MTLQNATEELRRTVETLWEAVSELVLICFEDQPDSSGLAGADQLAEHISEIQADVAAARELCARGDHAAAEWLAPVDRHLHQAGLRFWCDVQAAVPVNRLKAATRRTGGQWPAWHRTVLLSAERLSGPLDEVAAAMNTCWQDACQLLMTEQAAHPGGIAPDAPTAPDQTRRIS
jgi:hypothetical protein